MKFNESNHDQKIVKMKFWCNAGYTEEVDDVKIYDNIGKDEEEQIQEQFTEWLNNNGEYYD